MSLREIFTGKFGKSGKSGKSASSGNMAAQAAAASSSALAHDGQIEVATLAGGCFWCLDESFRLLRGVLRVESGYSGGRVKNPAYREVCGGMTGHAEVVQVTFDPTLISFSDLLDVFFTIHDPTTLNRQGADKGTQYRSAIFYHSDEQKRVAESVIADLNSRHVWDDPIVTELTQYSSYYPAEADHQAYYRRNEDQPYCRAVIAPKVAKLRQYHFAKLSA